MSVVVNHFAIESLSQQSLRWPAIKVNNKVKVFLLGVETVSICCISAGFFFIAIPIETRQGRPR